MTEPLRDSLRRVAWPFLVTRGGLLLWAWWICLTYAWPPDAQRVLPDSLWLDGWLRWDAEWYLSLTRGPYELSLAEMSNAAFFPLYPLLCWLLSTPLRLVLPTDLAVVLSGLALSYAGFLAGLVAVRRLALIHGSPEAAERAVWLLCVYPFSYFFSAFYTEGLYLGLAAWAFLLLERERDWEACLLAALALSCRVQGLFVGFGLALELARRNRPLLPLVLVPVALVGLLTFYSQEVGTPLGFVWAQRAWRSHTMVHELRYLADKHPDEKLIAAANLAALATTLVAAGLAVRRLGPGYALLTAMTVALPAITATHSLGRFACVLFPVFLVGGQVLSRAWLFQLVAVLGSLGLLGFSYLFVTWHPAY